MGMICGPVTSVNPSQHARDTYGPGFAKRDQGKTPCTMRFGSTAKVLAECKLKY